METAKRFIASDLENSAGFERRCIAGTIGSTLVICTPELGSEEWVRVAQLDELLPSHSPCQISFSSDGVFLAIGYVDGWVAILDVSATTKTTPAATPGILPVAQFKAHDGELCVFQWEAPWVHATNHLFSGDRQGRVVEAILGPGPARSLTTRVLVQDGGNSPVAELCVDRLQPNSSTLDTDISLVRRLRISCEKQAAQLFYLPLPLATEYDIALVEWPAPLKKESLSLTPFPEAFDDDDAVFRPRPRPRRRRSIPREGDDTTQQSVSDVFRPSPRRRSASRSTARSADDETSFFANDPTESSPVIDSEVTSYDPIHVQIKRGRSRAFVVVKSGNEPRLSSEPTFPDRSPEDVLSGSSLLDLQVIRETEAFFYGLVDDCLLEVIMEALMLPTADRLLIPLEEETGLPHPTTEQDRSPAQQPLGVLSSKLAAGCVPQLFIATADKDALDDSTDPYGLVALRPAPIGGLLRQSSSRTSSSQSRRATSDTSTPAKSCGNDQADSTPLNMLLPIDDDATKALSKEVQDQVVVVDPPLQTIAGRSRRPRRVAVVEDSEEDSTEVEGGGGGDSEHALPVCLKEVTLPISQGESLGMVFDITENKVFVKEFALIRSARDGSRRMGAAQASGEIDVGDMVLCVDEKCLTKMEFGEILDFVKTISISGRDRVVFRLCRAEFTHIICPLPSLSPQLAELSAVSMHSNHDPFLLLGFDPIGNAVATKVGTAGEHHGEKMQAFSFPGDIGLRLDPMELERRLAILMENTRRHRQILVEGRNVGWYEDSRVSPLFRLHTLKRYVQDEEGEYSVRLAHPKPAAESRICGSPGLLKDHAGRSGPPAITDDRSAESEGVHSGGIDHLGVPWWAGPLAAPSTLSFKQENSGDDVDDSRRGDTDMNEEDTALKESVLPSSGEKASGPAEAQKQSEISALERQRQRLADPVADVETEVVQVDAVVEELKQQLEFELAHFHDDSDDVRHSLGIIKDIEMKCGPKSASLEASEEVVSTILGETLRGLAAEYLGEKWASPLDAWPPRHLTSAVAVLISLHLRNTLDDTKVSGSIDSLLSSWMKCIDNDTAWLEVGGQRSSTSVLMPPLPPQQQQQQQQAIVVREHDDSSSEAAAFVEPTLKSAASLLYSKDVLHRNLLCDLVTLHAQLHIAGPKNLQVVQMISKKAERGAPMWKLHVRFAEKEAYLNSSAPLRLWTEVEALAFVDQYFDFLHFEELLICAGARRFSVLTARLIDLSTLSEDDPSCRHACELVARIIRHHRSPVLAWSTLLHNALEHARACNSLVAVLLETGQLLWRFNADQAAVLFSNEFPRIRPWHVWKMLASSFGPLTFSPMDVGLRVSVWWGGNEAYFRGFIVSYESSPSPSDPGRHMIRYDDGDVRTYDLTEKVFEVIPGESRTLGALSSLYDFVQPDSRSHRPLPVNECNAKSHRVMDAWWSSRVLYQKYLKFLLFRRDGSLANEDPRRFASIVKEFIQLSLLLSSESATNFFAEQIEPQTRVDDEPFSLSSDNLALYNAAIGGDCILERTTTSLRRRQIEAFGQAAKEERLRNSVIRAKCTPLFLGNPVSMGALDKEAWILRVVAHPDYFYLPDFQDLDQLSLLMSRWKNNTETHSQTHGFTNALNDDIEEGKLHSKLGVLEEVTAESNSSFSHSGNDGVNQSLINLSNGYRNAWSSPHMKTGLGCKLQEAWITMNGPRHLTRLSKEFNRRGHSDDILADAEEAIHPNEGSCADTSNTLSIALLCSRFAFWGGALKACEIWLDARTSSECIDDCVPILSPGLIVYEILRLAALSIVSGDGWKKIHDSRNTSALDCEKLMVITAFYLLGRLSIMFDQDPALERRMFPCLKLGDAGWTRSNRVLSGIIWDMLVAGVGFFTQESSMEVAYPIFDCMLGAFGVERSLCLLEMVPSLEFKLTSDPSFLQLIETYLQNEQRCERSPGGVPSPIPCSDQSVWAVTINESDVCNICALPLFAPGESGHGSASVIAFKCGHSIHNSCSGIYGHHCAVCRTEFSFLSC